MKKLLTFPFLLLFLFVGPDVFGQISSSDERSMDTALCIVEYTDDYGSYRDLGLLKEYVETKAVKLFLSLHKEYEDSVKAGLINRRKCSFFEFVDKKYTK